jgi:hypothetical protein
MHQATHPFESLYLSSPSNPLAYCFTDKNLAYNFGKKLARRLGFDIRIKTSSRNGKHGLVHKYLCCVREGAPLSQHVPEHERIRHRESVRCGCRWMAKIVGVLVHPLELNGYQTQLVQQQQQQQQAELIVWFWDQAPKTFDHNHDMQRSALNELAWDQEGMMDDDPHADMSVTSAAETYWSAPTSAGVHEAPHSPQRDSHQHRRLSLPASAMMTALPVPSIVAPSNLPTMEPKLDLHVQVGPRLDLKWHWQYRRKSSNNNQ